MNRATIVRQLPASSKKEIAISDIHGNLSLYNALLDKIGYQPGADRLILAGDLVEKGTQNLDMLHRVMEQQQNGEDIWCIMGNCDFTAKNILYSYRLDFIQDVLLKRKNSLIHEMAAKAGIAPLQKETDMSLFCQQIRKHYLKELCFLNDLPHILESDTRIYTHAGLVKEGDYNHDMRYAMTTPYFMNTTQRFHKTVICGHLPVTEYCRDIANFNVRYNSFSNIYGIDGGNMVKKAGQLNALIFDGNTIKTQSADFLPEVEVIQSTQPRNFAPLYLPWNHSELEVLKRMEKQSYVHSQYLNRSFWIENEFLKPGKEDMPSGTDFTSYEMPLKAGEKVKPVFFYQDKVQIKKNGILGWTEKKNLKL